MNPRNYQRWSVIAACLIGLVVMSGYAIHAKLSPAVVAVIDLEKLFNGLNQKADAEIALKQLADDSAAKFDTLRKEIESLEGQLEGFEVSSPRYGQISQELTEKLTRLSAFTDISRQKVSLRQARMTREIYQSIREATARYAKANGIDVVLLDDTIPPIEDGNGTDILRQISARRLIFADKALDITNDILSEMNRVYAEARTP